MLASRDQENLAHGHQAAAAAKPLNQGVKQLAPKTPGNKVPKTPFKLPLNDENGPVGFGGGKTGLKTGIRGNENFMTTKKGGLGDKNAFVTPLGLRNRAPLGLKTTNAKAKAFQTPAPATIDNDLDKGAQKSATARKAKPRVSHAEMTKLEILGDKNELEEREIEYMPPRSKDMPDYPDDMPHDIDLSMFANDGLTRGYWAHYGNPLGDDGLTHHERREKKQQERWDRMDKEIEEAIQTQLEGIIPCTHYPECPGDECKDAIAYRKEVKEKQRKKKAAAPSAEPSFPSKKPLSSKGPSTLNSKTAAAALSQNKATTKPKVSAPPTKAKLPTSTLPSRKKTPPPSNPSSMRQTAATVASRTMGYAAGRATSASLRKSVIPKNPSSADTLSEVPDVTLAPALYIQRYGVPAFGSEKWFECKRCGCFDEEDGSVKEELLGGTGALDGFLREEAEREFEFTW